MPMEVVDVDGGGHAGWRISAEDNGLHSPAYKIIL